MKRSLLVFVILAMMLSLMPMASSPAEASESVSGALYAGTSNPGVVYQYAGDSTWEPISTEEELDYAYAVLSLVEYNGHLYAGTMSTSDPMSGIGRVYRYDGGTSWTPVSGGMDDQVCCLVEYEGHLYAGTAWNSGKLYLYDGGTTWTPSVIGGWSGIRSAYLWDDSYLHLGDIGWDKLGRYDGTSFYYDANLGGSCIYDFESYGGYLYAGAYEGRLHRSSDGINWSTVRGYHDGNVWELEVFQDHLYMGMASGALERYDGTNPPVTVWTAPDDIISMVVDPSGNSLVIGVGGEAGGYYGSSTAGIGRVYSYDGINPPTPISGSMGTGVQVLYSPSVSFISNLQLPNVIVLRPSQSYTLTAQYYRSTYSPSDYFKVFYPIFPTGLPPTRDPYLDYRYAGGEAISYYQYSGWLARGKEESPGDYETGKYHIGQDIEANEKGDPVYAIADGEVRRVSTSGWDKNPGDNNVGILIEHTLNDGTEFLALYGHVHSDVEEGDWVYAGQSFATIGPYGNEPHLHFGIHPGTETPTSHEDPDPKWNIGWGRMGLNHWPDPAAPPPESKTNGFVDPVKWLFDNYVTKWADEHLPVGWQSFSVDLRAPMVAGTYKVKVVGCSGHGTDNSSEVEWDDPRSDGGFEGKAPDELSWNNYEIAGEVTIIVPFSFYLCSAADMVVTDPDGLTISKDVNEIPGATYLEVDLDGDGDPDDQVCIPNRKVGDYLITVVPEPEASPTDTYTLGVSADGMIIVLAENVQIGDIPVQGYIVRSTETELIQIIPATIDFDPNTLNLKSKGKVVTVYIELPTGYDVSQIDISSISLNGVVPALSKPTELGDYDEDGIPDLMVKFNRTDVASVLGVGEEIVVTVAGEVAGITFEGIDTIRVMAPGRPPAPPPGVGSTWEYLVDYDSGGGYTEVDHPFTVTLTEVDVVPPDFVCVPPAEPVLCNHYETDTHPDGGCPGATVPKRYAGGWTIIPMSVQQWANPADGTPVATYAPMCMTAPLPLGLVNGEGVYTDYTAISGTVGCPYAVGDMWTYSYIWNAEILGDCIQAEPSVLGATVEVVAVDVSVTVPAGTFTDCVQIVTTVDGTDNTRTVWWSPTVYGTVKQIDDGMSYMGVETWALSSYNLAP